jgi:hypothetical protein
MSITRERCNAIRGRRRQAARKTEGGTVTTIEEVVAELGLRKWRGWRIAAVVNDWRALAKIAEAAQEMLDAPNWDNYRERIALTDALEERRAKGGGK